MTLILNENSSLTLGYVAASIWALTELLPNELSSLFPWKTLCNSSLMQASNSNRNTTEQAAAAPVLKRKRWQHLIPRREPWCPEEVGLTQSSIFSANEWLHIKTEVAVIEKPLSVTRKVLWWTETSTPTEHQDISQGHKTPSLWSKTVSVTVNKEKKKIRSSEEEQPYCQYHHLGPWVGHQ